MSCAGSPRRCRARGPGSSASWERVWARARGCRRAAGSTCSSPAAAARRCAHRCVRCRCAPAGTCGRLAGRGQPRAVTVGRELLRLPSVHTECVCSFVLRFDPVVFHESAPAQDAYPVPLQGGWKNYHLAFKWPRVTEPLGAQFFLVKQKAGKMQVSRGIREAACKAPAAEWPRARAGK